jgi:hypothetical protein
LVAVTSVTVQINALPGAKRPGVMRAIDGDIGAAAAEKWNGDEKIAIKQAGMVARTGFLHRIRALMVLFVAEAPTKRRC